MKRDRWRDARVAGEYEARRFKSPLARWKHRRDETLVTELLARSGPHASVLDLPCGTGRLFPALQRAVPLVLGADLAREMLLAGRAARPEVRLPLLQADATRLPFADRSVDALVSLRFLFHFERAERVAMLTEFARVARRAVIVQVRHGETLKHRARGLRHRFGLARRYRPAEGRGELVAELAAAGLELVELAPLARLFSDKALLLARPIRARSVCGRRALDDLGEFER
jgi:SAM-dependent methyltransferase